MSVLQRRAPPFLLVAAALLFRVVIAQQPASQNAPRVSFVYPAGGQQGATVDVIVGGQFLNGASEAIVSGRGVRASVTQVDRPLNAQQLTALRAQIEALQPQAAADSAARQQLVTLRATLNDSVQRNRTPQFSELATVRLTIDAGADPGFRQLRLRTPSGLSAPLTVIVGQLPEVRERDVKLTRADAELPVSLPVTVNGRMIPGDVDSRRQPLRQPGQYRPGDVDRYRFSARQGQHLVVAVTARELQPFLADAVPGWFQAVATLLDASGREVSYCDDDAFRPDPVLHYEVPTDGEYVLEIRDALSRGREDFVDRASIGELPYVTHVFPLGVPAGARTTVAVAGWNLPSATAVVQSPRAPGTMPFSIAAGDFTSNELTIDVDALPERLEHEPNDAPAQAMSAPLPLIVNGRIGRPGDQDWYRVRGRAGDEVVAEVRARRLGSPLDSWLELVDGGGRRIAAADDVPDAGAGLVTHQADAYLRATLPADGDYYLRLRELTAHGGDAYGYRLRISAPRPDFELRVSPSAINLSNSSSYPLTVTAIRRDGFEGEIALSLGNAPAGFTLGGGGIPARRDAVRVTLTAPPAATRELRPVRIEGRASVGGRTIVREATAADDRQQAFAWRHLVDAEATLVAVSGRGGTRVPIRVLGPSPVAIPVGGAVRVHVSLPAAYQAFDNLEFELNDPPDGITLEGTVVGLGRTSASFVLRARPDVAAGFRDNLIILMSGERRPAAGAANQARRRAVIAVLPAVDVVCPRAAR